MSRRVFTPKTKKEQLQQQVLMMIRIIRRKLDADVLAKANEIAVDLQREAKKHAQGLEQSVVSKTAKQEANAHQDIPFDKDNARAAVSGFLMLNKHRPEIAGKIFKMLNE